MPTVAELSGPYENFMLSPRHGRDVCSACFNLTDGYGRCYACAHCGQWLEAMVPISYSVAGEQLHHALAGYKRYQGTAARHLALGLAAVVWRFLAGHERCLARAADVAAFTLVTTVPSSGCIRDAAAPPLPGALEKLVAELVQPARERYQRVLRRSATAIPTHRFSAERFEPLRALHGESVLLIDDTWTTGANAQSAAAALKLAGAGTVASVVIGRHVNRGWARNDSLLRDLTQPFDWNRCALCGATEHE